MPIPAPAPLETPVVAALERAPLAAIGEGPALVPAAPAAAPEAAPAPAAAAEAAAPAAAAVPAPAAAAAVPAVPLLDELGERIRNLDADGAQVAVVELLEQRLHLLVLHVEAQAGVIRENANAPDAVGGGTRNLRHGAEEVPGEDHVSPGNHRRLADVAGEHRARGRGLGVPGEGRERRGENLALGPPIGTPVLDRREDLLRRRGEVREQLVVDEVNLDRCLLCG